METKKLSELISIYKSSPSIETFKDAVDGNLILPMCKICNEHIWYSNTEIRMDSKTKKLKIDTRKPSGLSKKIIFDKNYYLSVCFACLKNQFNERLDNVNISRIFNTINEISKFCYGIEDEVAKKHNQSKRFSLEKSIQKYGEKIGREKWDNYREIQSITNSFEYKRDNYGWNREQFDEYNKSRAVTSDLLIKKYGEKEGAEKYLSYVEKQKVNGKTIEYFIEKYGDAKGREEFHIMNLKKIQKPKSGTNISVSKVSQEFFHKLDPLLRFDCIYYSKDGYEERIDIKEIFKYYYLDFYIPELSLNVEFNGDFYHANPKIYKDPSQKIRIFKKTYKVQEIWDKDQERVDNILNYKGIRTIVIWERDYYNSKGNENFIKNVLSKINEYAYI